MAINVYELLQYKNGKPYLYKEGQILNEGSPKNTEELYYFIKHNTKLTLKAEEHALLIGLNKRNKILAVFWLSKGVVDATMVNQREIFIRLLLVGASGFVIVHNHPSGSLEPSREDLNIQRTLKDTGEFMKIPLVDFVIVTQEHYTSVI